MFGYINANRNELSEEEKIEYQRYYCGLCQELHKQAGCKAQLLLNYDLCFLTLLLSGLYETDTSTEEFRCLIHPVAKKHAYINEFTEYAAAMDIILSYHSLMDNYNDDHSKMSKLFADSLKKKYKGLVAMYPRQVKAVESYISNLSVAEANNETNIDVVSNFTGEMLSEIFDYKQDEWSKDLRALGFYMGKFIYIIDAYDDLKKDEKTGSYNPLSRMKAETPKEYETFVRVNLTSLMAECAKSFERLPIIENTTILRNIIYSGVWTKYEYLQIKEKRKQNDAEAMKKDFKETKE